jgi:hypothetical protein
LELAKKKDKAMSEISVYLARMKNKLKIRHPNLSGNDMYRFCKFFDM